MAKRVRNGNEQNGLTVTLGRLKKGLLLTAFLALAVIYPGLVQAGDKGGFDHAATTYTNTQNPVAPLQVAEIACCHCVSYLSNGQRFYHGVIPIQNCVGPQIRGHCEGEAKCFQ